MSGHLHNWEHSIQNMQGPSLLLAIVFAAILGSIHCVAMCGAISTGVTGGHKLAVIQYQLGRLIGYSSLGFAAGSLGYSLLGGKTSWLSLSASALVMVFILYMAVQIFTEGRVGVKTPQWLQKLFLNAQIKIKRIVPPSVLPFTVGVMTPLLPCGWLWGLLAAVSVTGNPSYSSAIMAAFWVGTTPALSLVAMGWRQMQPAKSQWARGILSLLILCLGLLTVLMRF